MFDNPVDDNDDNDNDNDDNNENDLIEVSAVALVWLFLRGVEGFDNPVDDIDIINSSNAALGPGLAYNYWNSLLKILLGKISSN